MADESDVADALVGIIAATIYPNGPSSASVGGVDMRVRAGWPTPDVLKSDFADGHSAVSVYPLPTERNTTRYLGQQWSQVVVNTPTLTLTASGLTVTVGGVIPPPSNPHHVAIFVNGYPYAYLVQPSDTLASIATALAQLIGVNVQGVFVSGATLTFPAGPVIGACRVGITGTSIAEVSRQEKLFQITIWSPTPMARRTLTKAIDPALKSLTFIALPDGMGGRIRYTGSRDSDASEKQGLFKRTLMYTVEYGTTIVRTDPQITQMQMDFLFGPDASWSADSDSIGSTDTADASQLADPSNWSADSPDVAVDSSDFTADSTPPPRVTVYI